MGIALQPRTSDARLSFLLSDSDSLDSNSDSEPSNRPAGNVSCASRPSVPAARSAHSADN
jgi:hypothetical protein